LDPIFRNGLLDLVSWMAFTKAGKWDTQVQAVQVDQTISPFAWLDQPCRFLFPGFAYVSILGRLATYWNRRLSGCFIAARYIGKLSFHHFPFFPFNSLWAALDSLLSNQAAEAMAG